MSKRTRILDTKHFLVGVTLNRPAVKSFKVYPFSLPAVRQLRRLEFHPAVTFLVGENGSGKSTLLEALAVAWGFNAEGGSLNHRFATRASHSPLHEFLKIERGLRRPRDGWFLRAESFFNVATNLEELDAIAAAIPKLTAPPLIRSYGGNSLHEQSHGESFMRLLNDRFGGHGLYLLDEPEAALSPTRQLGLLTRLHDLVEQGAQFIIATHSPIIMAFPNASILQLTEAGIRPVKYTETEHYAITRMFLNNHERMLRELTKNSD
ncbi:MAG: AAA family ATPase [Verrucomicrobiota bacterium]